MILFNGKDLCYGRFNINMGKKLKCYPLDKAINKSNVCNEQSKKSYHDGK